MLPNRRQWIVMTIIEYAVVGCLILAMVTAGWILPIGYPLSWPMYAWMTASVVTFQVVDVDGESTTRYEVNPYEYLPRGEFIFDPVTVDLLAVFVARERNVKVEPVGELVGPFGRVTVRSDTACLS